MISIVCFGDSNTFGLNPHGGRWEEDIRWPRVMQKNLRKGYYVIEEGLCGRDTVFTDPIEPGSNGAVALPLILKTHKPINILIISLGTNDTKEVFHANERYITKGMEKLVHIAQDTDYGEGFPKPKILIISPIHIYPKISESHLGTYFNADSVQKCNNLAKLYAELAEQMHIDFLDAALFAKPSDFDCIHLGKEGHLALAKAITKKILEM